MNELVVFHPDRDNAAVHLGRDANEIGEHFRVVRLRILVDFPPNRQANRHGAYDDQ